MSELARPAVSSPCYSRAGSLTSGDTSKNLLNLVFAGARRRRFWLSLPESQRRGGAPTNFQFEVEQARTAVNRFSFHLFQ